MTGFFAIYNMLKFPANEEIVNEQAAPIRFALRPPV